jgi:hypothetical protein
MSVNGKEPLRTYTIFQRPTDMPQCPYVVREFVITVQGAQPGSIVGVGKTLQEARALLPVTADVVFPRNEGDPPTVVETWM